MAESKSKSARPMINFYKTIKQVKKANPYYKEHGLDVLLRGIICTASGGGKTNLLMNILYQMSDTYWKIIIITKEQEPLYDMLKERLKDRVEIHYGGNMPELPALTKREAGIVIFDDMVLSQTKEIGEVFIRCRKQEYAAIFISQSYFGINKIIRQNCNYIWLGRGILDRDLKLILSEYSVKVGKEKLLYIYNKITEKPMHFMMLDLSGRAIREDINDIILKY